MGRNQLRLLVTGALYLVSTAALLRALKAFIDNPMTHAVIGAAAVSLIAARVEVPGERFGPRAQKRMAWGAAIALTATAVGISVVLATGGSLAVSGVSAAAFFGVAEAVGVGYAAEMLLRGIPLTYAKRAGIPDGYAFTFAAMAGVAAIVLEPNAKPMGLVLTAASGAAFTALWIRGGDGHAPITAHILWVWLTDAALSGELLQLTKTNSILSSRPQRQRFTRGRRGNGIRRGHCRRADEVGPLRAPRGTRVSGAERGDEGTRASRKTKENIDAPPKTTQEQGEVVKDARYHPFYCEENAWWLCQRPELGDGPRDVVFITNAAKQCLLREQRNAPVGEHVIWDYHVIVVVGDAVWDLDTRMDVPVEVTAYLDATFPELPPEMSHMAPRFRVVAADELVRIFHTDRTHMRDAHGGWLQPPPSWEPPTTEGPPNQTRFTDLSDDIAGDVLDLPALRARYSR